MIAKKLLLFSTVFAFLFVFSYFVLAQETTTIQSTTSSQEAVIDEEVDLSELEVEEPTILPDSPFYFLKKWQRGIRSFFTFNPVKKAELRLRFASEKLLEAKKLAEKKKASEILEKATENYEKEMEEIKDIIEKFKEKASENPEIGKFLDKFIKQQVLHEKILQKLEDAVPEQALERIRETRERHLRRFSEVMEKLEDKEKIAERIEKVLENIKGSEFKHFKNLEILKRIEETSPEKIKEKIREARGRILERFKEKISTLPPETQEKLENYIERIKGEVEDKMEILEDIRSALKNHPEIRERLEKTRERMLNRAIKIKRKGTLCPELTPPGPGFCKEGRIVMERDEKGCLVPKCVTVSDYKEQKMKEIQERLEYKERKRETIEPSIGKKRACLTLWDPVCGADGKTYSNNCFAEIAGEEKRKRNRFEGFGHEYKILF